MSDNFTLDEYRQILSGARQSRRFVAFDDLQDSAEMCVLWRHDVDASLRSAVQLAEVDHDHGVLSTFFINIHSDTYNARSRVCRSQAADIIAMGHRIGIHLDAAYYGHFETQSTLERVRLEKALPRNQSSGSLPESI